MPYDMAHGVGVLTTKGDLAFIGGPDGYLLALDARTGEELWRFQTGAAISSSPIAYEINDEQYVAVYAGGTGIPYGNTSPRGDYLWAFKVGGRVAPAPSPWTAREAMSRGIDHAAPQSTDPARNSAMPTSMTGLRPSASASFP